MRRIVVILLFACIFAVATVASAKVCFLPHIFGGDESCLRGFGSGGNNPDLPPNPPQPADPCEPDAVSQILGGWEGGLFDYEETSYNSGCYKLECSGVNGSRPQNTFNETVFEVASIRYGNLTCYYATACKAPYENATDLHAGQICVGGYVLEDHELDGLKCVKCSDDSDPCPVNECSGYSLTEAPAHGKLAGSSCQVIYEENGECKQGPLKYNGYDCDEGYKPQNSTCVEKTCSDYGYLSFHCDSWEEEISHVVSLGSISGMCYECREICDENPCYGYNTYTKPENSHWTSEACHYVHIAGTWCVDGGYWYKGWECDSGYEKSGESCVPITSCTPNPCTGYNTNTKPQNSHWTSEACHRTSGSSCTDEGYWYKGWECDSGYTQSGNSCVVSGDPEDPEDPECEPEYCGGYNLRTIPANATPTGSCQWVYSDCRKGDIWYLGFECNEGYVEVGNECRLIQPSCTPEPCTGYSYTESNLPHNSYGVNSCQVVNTDCSNGALKYADFACNNGYERSGNACVPTSSCTPEPCAGYSYTASTLPANSHGVNSCQVTVAPDCANGDLKYADFACDGGWIKQGNQCVEPTPMTCADVPGSPPATQAECENDCVSCRSQNFQGVWCWVPSGCKSGCVTGSDKVSFYDYTSYGNDCYKPSGCASGWQSTPCSGTGVFSYTGTKTAHGSGINCTKCERCTDSPNRYNSQADCRMMHWPEYCQSNTCGTDPSVTCWDGSCSKAEFPYAIGLINGALIDDRDCCKSISGAGEYCSNFLCDEYNGYIRQGNGCVCNLAGGWSQGGGGTCYCEGRIEDTHCIVGDPWVPTTCPQNVVGAHNAIGGEGTECRNAISNFCSLYRLPTNYAACNGLYGIPMQQCTPDYLESIMCDEEKEP